MEIHTSQHCVYAPTLYPTARPIPSKYFSTDCLMMPNKCFAVALHSSTLTSRLFSVILPSDRTPTMSLRAFAFSSGAGLQSITAVSVPLAPFSSSKHGSRKIRLGAWTTAQDAEATTVRRAMPASIRARHEAFTALDSRAPSSHSTCRVSQRV